MHSLAAEMDALTWNSLIAGLPNPHVLQTWEWGQVKARVGWQPLPQVWRDGQGRPQAAGLALQRSLTLAGVALPVRVLYAPKGPLLDWTDEALRRRVLDDLAALAHKQGAIFVKIDPDVRLGVGLPENSRDPLPAEDLTGQAVLDDLRARGWRFSGEQIQFRNTVQIDLTASEDEMLARMKQKTRYNLRLAQRKGVTVRAGSLDDLGLLYHMYAETSARDGFVIREEGYYRQVWADFMRAGMAEPLVAHMDGEPLAAVIVFRFGGRAWYLYGMSRELHRETMPNYLLQWEAMRRAKAAGSTVYDLWGAPDRFDEDDPLWGVFRFKEGLGGQVVRTLGAWDLPVRPRLYQLYTQTLPRVLGWMRRRRIHEVHEEAGIIRSKR